VIVKEKGLVQITDTSALEKAVDEVIAANPKQLEILKTYDVADSATWAQPVLSGQRVFIKDLSTISLWTLN